MLTDMYVAGLLIDKNTDQPVVMLSNAEGALKLPIVIGLAEAGAIVCELEDVHFPRPMSHDLMRDILLTLRGQLLEVQIHDLVDGTFHAALQLQDHQGLTATVDARPSDAIALAIRLGAPIRVSQKVIDQAAFFEPITAKQAEPIATEPLAPAAHIPANATPEELANFLAELEPDDFGKYKV